MFLHLRGRQEYTAMASKATTAVPGVQVERTSVELIGVQTLDAVGGSRRLRDSSLRFAPFGMTGFGGGAAGATHLRQGYGGQAGGLARRSGRRDSTQKH